MSTPNYPPGPKGLPILGSIREFAGDALGFAESCRQEYGNIIDLKLFGVEGYLVLHPDEIQQVLVKNQKNYTKATRGIMKLRTVFGTGLLTSEGDFWKRQRRIAQPAFKKGTIASFAEIMVESTRQLCERWSAEFLDKPSFDLYQEMMSITLKIVSKTLLGQDASSSTSSVGQALEHAIRITNARLLRPIDVPLWMPTKENRRLDRAIAELDSVVHQLIADQRSQEVDNANLLSMLIHAKDPETGEGMTDDQLRDEVLIMFVAGHETTANTLAWLWYNLSQSADADQAIAEEVTRVLNTDTVTLQQVADLKFTEAVIKETMRLYPPGWWFARRALGDDNLKGYHVPEGHHVWMCAYITHRHPDLWDEPNTFKPERFLTDNITDSMRYAYFPFGGGPRQCIGSHFAMLEMKLIVAMLVKNFRLQLPTDFVVEPSPLTTLRPRYGMEMRLERRG